MQKHMSSTGAAFRPFCLRNPRRIRIAVSLVAVALTALLARQILMPAINAATDAGQLQRFKFLHGLSVVITLGHIAVTGWLLTIIV